jgi:hypothetical protein
MVEMLKQTVEDLRRARPLTSRKAVVELIAATTTATGLKVAFATKIIWAGHAGAGYRA